MKFVGGTVYTYVEVEMFPFHRMTSSKPRTKYIRNEFSPVFNDEVCIKILKEEVDDQKMYLHVCDYNQISTRDLIGSYKMNLDDVSFKSKGKETVYEGDLRWIDSVSHALFYTVVVVRCLLTLANIKRCVTTRDTVSARRWCCKQTNYYFLRWREGLGIFLGR